MAAYNIYYSPTGGTKRVADILSGAICDGAKSVDLLKKDTQGLCFERDDLCIVSVPAFGGRVPDDARKKLLTFKANGAAAVLAAVFGNRAADDTLAELCDIAESVGFRVTAAAEAVAEHSLARMYGKGRPNGQDRAELEAFGKRIAKKLKEGDCSFVQIQKDRPYKELKTMSMKPLVGDGCVKCNKCVCECPVGAISAEDVRKVDADKCFSCMHCVSTCPTGARGNDPDLAHSLEERLKDRCAEPKANKLYI